jgi:hypothetical protein
MPEMVKSSETKLFADDSLLFRTINNQADSVLLQNDLTSLQDFELVHDVAVDYMLQYLTCDGGEGNRSIVGG